MKIATPLKLSDVPPGRYFGLRQAHGTLNELYVIDPYNNVCTIKDGKYEKFTANAKHYNLAFKPHLHLETPWPHAKGAVLSDDRTLPLLDGTLVQGYLSGRIFEIKDKKLVSRADLSPETSTTMILERFDSYNVIDIDVAGHYMGSDGWGLEATLKSFPWAWRFTSTGSRMYVAQNGRAITYRNGQARWVSSTTIKQSGWLGTKEVPAIVKSMFEGSERTLEEAQALNPESSGFMSASGVAYISSIGVPVCLINGVTKFALLKRPYTELRGWKPYNSWYKALSSGTLDYLRDLDTQINEGAGLRGVYHQGSRIYADLLTGSVFQVKASEDGSQDLENYYFKAWHEVPTGGWMNAETDISLPLDPNSAINAALKTGWSCAVLGSSTYYYCGATAKTYYYSEGAIQVVNLPIGCNWLSDTMPEWYGKSWMRQGDAEIYSSPGDGLFYALKSTGGVEKRFSVYLNDNPSYWDGVPDWFERYKKFGPRGMARAEKVVAELSKKYSLGPQPAEPEVKVPPAPDAKISGNFTPEQMIQLIGDLKSLVEILLKAGQKEQAEKLTERIIYLSGSISWSMR